MNETWNELKMSWLQLNCGFHSLFFSPILIEIAVSFRRNGGNKIDKTVKALDWERYLYMFAI